MDTLPQTTYISWSHNGKYIGLVSGFSEGHQQINVMDADGTNFKTLFDNRKPPYSEQIQPYLAWSPDDSYVLFYTIDYGLYSINIQNQKLAQLLKSPYLIKLYGNSWSPNGKQIVYEAGKEFTPNSQIYTITPDGVNIVQLTVEGSNHTPTWSPDGKKIAFISNRNALNPNDWQVYTMDANGMDQKQLTQHDTNLMPEWIP